MRQRWMLGLGVGAVAMIGLVTLVTQALFVPLLLRYHASRPPARTTCPLPNSEPPAPGELRVGILFHCDEAWWRTSGDWTRRSLANREKYAALHGYEVVLETRAVEPRRPAAWSKLLAARHHLQRFDWLAVIDVDALIMNPERRLEELLPPDATLRADGTLREKAQANVVLTADWSGPNSGSMLLRNDPWTFWFLDEAYAQELFLRQPGPGSALSPKKPSWPFEYEQRSVHYLLQTPLWKALRNVRYEGDVADMRRNVAVLPQCTMNSYLMHPFMRRNFRGEAPFRDYFDVAQYVDGDFIIHFAGYKGHRKQDLVERFATWADAKLEAASMARASAAPR